MELYNHTTFTYYFCCDRVIVNTKNKMTESILSVHDEDLRIFNTKNQNQMNGQKGGSYFATCSEGKFCMQMPHNQVGHVFVNMLENCGIAMIGRQNLLCQICVDRQYVSAPSGSQGAECMSGPQNSLFDSETPKCTSGFLFFIG